MNSPLNEDASPGPQTWGYERGIKDLKVAYKGWGAFGLARENHGTMYDYVWRVVAYHRGV